MRKVSPKVKEQRALLAPTPATELRRLREEGVVLGFPSGNHYRITLPGIDGMLARGDMPNPLLTFVVDAFYNGTTQDKYNAFFAPKEQQEDALALFQSLKVICQAMFLEPRVVDVIEGDDEVTIADIPLGDRQWAFRLLFAPVEEVYPFRGESAPDVGRLPRVETVLQASERELSGT